MRPKDELSELIAEQEKDMRSGDRVFSASLDAQLNDDAGMTWGDLLAAPGSSLPRSEPPTSVERHSTASDARHGMRDGYQLGCRCDRCKDAEKRYRNDLRDRGPADRTRHGTLTMYMRYECRCDACIFAMSLWNKIQWRKQHRKRQNLALLCRLRDAVEDYIGGARIIDVATAIHKDVGYATPESCYQRLREMFHEVGVPVRPQRWKHGHRSHSATPEELQAYWKRNNRKARDRHRAKLRRCPATTKKGEACKRWAISESRYCVSHRQALV